MATEMIKNVKFLTTFILLLILLNGVFSLSVPVTKARFGDIYNCYTIIKIDYDRDAANDPFLPIDMTKEIPLTINLTVEGYFKEDVPPAYKLWETFIWLGIEKKPEWCNVSISPNFLKMLPRANGKEKNATLIIKIDKNAHAKAVGAIQLNVTVENMGAVKGGTFFSNISFIPGYLPMLKLNIPDDTVKLIGPLDTTNFEIEIENIGNAKTVVKSHIVDMPDGWTATINSETIIGSSTIGDNPKKTIYLTVRPPFEFGYHNDREVIQVSIIPSFFEDPSLSGQEYTVSFIVQSKGFSTPGFETALSLLAFIGVFLLIKKRNNKVTINKDSHGEDDT